MVWTLAKVTVIHYDFQSKIGQNRIRLYIDRSCLTLRTTSVSNILLRDLAKAMLKKARLRRRPCVVCNAFLFQKLRNRLHTKVRENARTLRDTKIAA